MRAAGSGSTGVARDVDTNKSTDVDAVVVGSGPNGLVAAVTLAEAGWRVLVLEAADAVGGGLRTEQLTLPGFHHDLGATVHALAAASPAFRALDLERDGLRFAHAAIPVGHVLSPDRSVLLHRDAAATAAGLGRDGQRWARVFGGLGDRIEPLAASVLDLTAFPPNAARELIEFGARGLWPATAAMRVSFSEEPARALFAGLAAHAVLDLGAPLTAGIGTFMAALAHGVGWPVAVDGSQSIVDALVARLHSLGGEVRTGHRVTTLAELPSARATLLDVGPDQLLRIAGDALPSGAARRLARWRNGPAVFKLDWALDGPIPWRDPALAGAGTVHLGGTAAEVVASEREVMRGRVSKHPLVMLVQATVADPSRAPAGKHTAWAYCHVPNGWPGDATELIEGQIEAAAPGFRARILGRHTMSPAALEAWNANLVGGDIGGGSADWRQMLSRPRVSREPWATGVPGLFLCSASTLPAGGAHGMGGYNAARTVLRRLG